VHIPGEFNPPPRLLLGPGPSPIHPQVSRAMTVPILGHLDPAFLDVMTDVRHMLKDVFQSDHSFALPVSGTGTAGMETCVSNLISEGDKAVMCVCGYFGDVMAQQAARYGADVIRIDAEWGQPIDPADVKAALSKGGVKLVGIVHVETSTGVLQPLDEIAQMTHEHGAMLLVDAVTSLGSIPVEVKRLGIDAVFSATQKCVGAPPGLAPISLNDKAVEIIQRRTKPIQAWYLDLQLLAKYWQEGSKRNYHHTAPIAMVYALREALRMLLLEGLEERWARHALNGKAMEAGLEAMGLNLLVEKAWRQPMVLTPTVPEGIDAEKVRQRLLNEYNIEVGAGFSDLNGKIWRVGLMGYGSQKNNVVLGLAALEGVLAHEGYQFEQGASVKAAIEVYLEAGQ
jgi:alanine-glyoxylate transaminase / serine-glyoxylate transaminase / serine-pyruvate transaminase